MKAQLINTCIIAVIIFSSCGSRQEKVIDQTPIIETITPIQSKIQMAIASSGTISNSEEIVLSFKTGGMVESVYAEEGQYVEKGQILARLNTTELDAQLEQAKLNVDKLKRDEYRLSQLVRDTVATLEQLQNAQTVLSSGQQQLRSLEFNREQAYISAPAAGFILRRQVNPGEFKTPGAAVFVIGSNSNSTAGKWTFKISVSDRDRVKLAVGLQTVITLDVMPGKEFDGTIIKLSSVPDAKTGTYDCYVSFDPQGENVVYGLSGKLSIPHESEQSFTEIPLEALVGADGNTAVIYTLNSDNIVEKQTISIHSINKQTVSINENLPVDLHIITSGKNKVKVGEKAKLTAINQQ